MTVQESKHFGQITSVGLQQIKGFFKLSQYSPATQKIMMLVSSSDLYTIKNNIMISCCQIPREKLEKDPQKYLKSHIMICMLEGNTVVCSIGEKKNNSGIMYNDRFLLLHGHNYIGYFNTLDPAISLPFKSLADVPKMKYSIPLKNISSWSIQDKALTIKYTVQTNGKKQDKQWLFKFDTIDLSKDWKLHLKRAEQSRKDSEKKGHENKNKPPTIIGIQKQFKDNRGIIGTSSIDPVEFEQQRPAIKLSESIKRQNSNSKPIDDKVGLNSSIEIPRPLTMSTRVNPRSILAINSVGSEGFPNEKIIDKTQSPASYVKPTTPSPKSKIFMQSSLNNSKFSAIENIHAKSPSLNSSFRQSPSLHSSLPPSNYGMKPATNNIRQELSKEDNFLSKKTVQQKSPKWKQPVLLKERWNYRAQLENLPFVLYQLKKYSQATVRQIVDNLAIGNPQLKLKRKSQFELMIQHDEFTALLCFQSDKEGGQNKSHSKDSIIAVHNEFNNMEYIFTCTENKFQPLTILTSITIYKGILVYLLCNISGNSLNSNLSSNTIQRISQKTRITTAWKPQSIIQNSQLKKKYLIECETYLPTLNHIQLCRNFIQLPDFQSQRFTTGDLSTLPSKVDKKIEYIEKVMIEQQKYAVRCLDDFKQPMTNSRQFQLFLIKYGLNQLQLGQLYMLSNNTYVKRLIGFQCVFRVARTIYEKQLQMSLTTSTDMGINLIVDKNILLLNSNKSLIQITVNFLNSMTGKYKSSNVILEIINSQLGSRFGIYNIELSFNDGYYLQGLIYHLNLGINWNTIKSKKGFNPEFTNLSINQFLLNSKVYNCDFHLEFKGIIKLLETKTDQSYKILLQSLDLYKSPIPQYYKLSDLYEKIRVFISLFLSPIDQQQRFKHLNLYNNIQLEPPTFSSIELQISTFKWALKQNNKEQFLSIFDDLTNYITLWLGPYHPYLLSVYNLLSSYYQSIEQYDQAITLAKSSIVNCLKIFGGNSLQLAQAYILLADIYSSMQRYDESLVYEKKAKAICDSNNQVQNISYNLMLMRISKLQLHFGKVNEALEDILTCIDFFDKTPIKEEYIVSAFELAARCYEVAKDVIQYKKLVDKILTKLVNILDPIHLEKMIKIVIVFPIKELKKEVKSTIKQMIDRLPRTVSEQAYIEGYQYMRSCLKQDRLDFYIESSLKNLHPFQNLQNTLLQSQRSSENQKAVSLLKALRSFLGTGFVVKLLN